MGSTAGQLALSAGLIAAGTALLFVPGGQPFGSALISAGIGVGLGAAAQAFAPGIETPKSGPVNRTIRSGLAFEQVPYGRLRAGGVMVAMDRHLGRKKGGPDDDYLDLVVVVSARRIEAFRALYVGDERVVLELNAGTVDKNLPADTLIPVTGSKYRRFVGVRWYDGSQVAADAWMISRRAATPGFWTADHKLLGYAYAIVSLRYSQSVWAAGIPSISFEIDGVRVYDPRTTATAWSDNVALCIADYLASDYGPAGVGYPEIDQDALIAAANVCDELVTLPAAEKRYRISTVISAQDDWRNVAPDMAQAMAGGFFRVGATWVVIAGAEEAPSISLGPDDMVGELDVTPRRSRRDLFNRAAVVCRDEADRYQSAEPPLLAPARYLAEDAGIILPRELDLTRMVASTGQAQRIASIELHQVRQQITATGTFRFRALTVQVGEVVLITSERMGWADKPFRVVAWELDFQEGIKLGLAEYCDAVYAYPADAALFLCAPSTNFPAPVGAAIVPFITVTRAEVGNSLIEWGQPAAFNLAGYDVRWIAIGEVPADGYAFGNGTWIALETSVVYSSGFIAAGINELAVALDWTLVYRVEVRVLLAGGIYGDWRSVVSFPISP